MPQERVKLPPSFLKTVLYACGQNRGGCSCGLIWGEDCVVAAVMSAKNESYTGGEGMSEKMVGPFAIEMARRWNAQSNFWNRLKNLF